MLDQLKKMLGEENFFDDRASIVALSAFPAQAKDMPLPRAALYPRHEGHIRDILAFCRENDFTLRIMGGGTSCSHKKHRPNELLLLTGGLNRILALEEENRSVFVQSGLTLAALEKRLSTSRLFLPFQSGRTSPATLGGLIAANTPCLYSLCYGSPGNFVQELEIFHSTGEKSLARCQNDQPLAPAFPLAPLFIGSRGHLGLISAIKIRLLSRPPARKSFIIACENNMEAIQASSRILGSGLTPASLEVISAEVAQLCASSGQPCLYLSFYGSLPYLEDQYDALCRLFEPSKPRLLSGEEDDSFLSAYALWSMRLRANAAFARLTRLACPQDKLICFMEALEEILQETGIKAAFAIHAGLAYIRLLFHGASPERIKSAEKNIFTTNLILNNKMSSERDADLAPDEWRNLHGEDMLVSRKIADTLDPCKIFSASLF